MARAHYYVDYSGGNDTTGNGSAGTPWKTIQKALDTVTEGADGTQVNLKDNAAHVTAAALDRTTYVATNGAVSLAQPIIFRGYTTTADDGGRATITVGGNYRLFAATNYDFQWLVDLTIDGHTGALVDTVYLGNSAVVLRCRVTGAGQYKLRVGNNCVIANCHISGSEFSATTSYCIYVNSASIVYANWINFAGHDRGIYAGTTVSVIGNVLVNAAAGEGGRAITFGASTMVIGNTVYSNAGTGEGIANDTNAENAIVANNVVVGFSGAGGDGILNGNGLGNVLLHNALYGNTTNLTAGDIGISEGNDTLAGNPFADAAGGDYDISGVVAGLTEDAWPVTWPGLTTATTPKAEKGAVQAGAGAGGAAVYRRVARILGV